MVLEEKIVEIVDARGTTDIQVITKAHPEHSSGELKMEKGDNSQSIDARVIYLKRDVSPYHTLSMDEISLQ